MSQNTSNGNGEVGQSDQQFMKKAAQGGQAEVELGQLAVQKAGSDAVKQFGQRMVDDHTKANQDLQSVASKKGISLPTKLDPKDAATKARLEKLSGAQFDHAYMHDMVKDHTKDVAEFQKEASSGQDPDVKEFASKAVPTLQDHLKEAKNIASGAQNTASNQK